MKNAELKLLPFDFCKQHTWPSDSGGWSIFDTTWPNRRRAERELLSRKLRHYSLGVPTGTLTHIVSIALGWHIVSPGAYTLPLGYFMSPGQGVQV